MNNQKASAIIAKMYLKSNGFKSYDLRPFDFRNGNQSMLKVKHLLTATAHLTHSEQQKSAREYLKDVITIETGADFVKELMQN